MGPRDFYRGPATTSTPVTTYRPLPHTLKLNTVGCVAGIVGMSAVAIAPAQQGRWLAAGVFILAAALCFVGLVYIATVRVVIDDHAITRHWLGGRKTMALADIGRLSLWQYKGTLTLGLYRRHTRLPRGMSFSSDAFDWQDIRCMHRDILLALGLDDAPMWPRAPRWFGMLDVERELECKRRQAQRGEPT